MTTQTEALKMALEALDGLYMPNELERVNKAITAIKEALAQQSNEQVEPVAWRHSLTGCLFETKEEVPLADGDECAEPLYTHPPVPTAQLKEPTPVAIVIEDLEHDGQGWCSKVRWIYNPVPVGETLSWEQP